MGRTTKKGRDNGMRCFVALTWDVLNSPAYKRLPKSAGKALPYWLGKVKTPYNDRAYYETKFSFPYAEAKKYGFAPGTWNNVINDLVRHGFVDPVGKGGLRGDGKSCNYFRLSKRWLEYGKQSFQCVSWKEFAPRKAI